LDTPLVELIRRTIRAHGPQSFAWFMQQALYHPQHGYYSSGRCVIGRKGDYFTSVSVGPLFGQLLSAQFREIWDCLGKIDKFTIVEQGAHDGQFACDVLESAQKHAPEFFNGLRYRIVEPFPILKERQQQSLESFRGKVEWHESLEPFTGVLFSNELLDAMPVRLIDKNSEKFIGLDGDSFVFVERQREDREEFNYAALNWLDDVAAKLQRGYVLAVDFGRLDREFHGTVHVRMKHRNLDSPFEQIGYADITMPVHWKSIAERARKNGLYVAGFTDQHHFLAGIVSEFVSSDLEKSSLISSPKAKRELQTLLHPEMLGRAFQVLLLEKSGLSAAPQLAGFKFAPEPSFA
jgi:SAM-dependent MidA family methyltransferase